MIGLPHKTSGLTVILSASVLSSISLLPTGYEIGRRVFSLADSIVAQESQAVKTFEVSRPPKVYAS
jgi:hypothetical protein